MENKNILVTGGAGAVGSNLIKRLILNGANVTSWDNYSAGKKDNHFPYCNYVRIDTNEAAEAFDPKFDLVVLFATSNFHRLTDLIGPIDGPVGSVTLNMSSLVSAIRRYFSLFIKEPAVVQ